MTDGAGRDALEGRKRNCWEFMQCGREPGGSRVAEMGVCPAAVESRLDGILGGTNAGRCCWAVAGTFCKGGPEGTFAKRYATCRECEFFKSVQAEKLPFLWHLGPLLNYVSSTEEAERDRYARVLTRLVVPAVVACAVADPSVLEQGDERHVTALFSDVTGFSSVSDRLNAASLGRFLNEYLFAMTEILKDEGGTLDKYIGDAVVGIFGAPLPLENDALSAARAALRMQRRLSLLRTEWREHRAWCPQAWSLRMRIGLSSGLAKVGVMGTAAFASYTMTGATVNLGKRLEQACKIHDVSILVSEATRDLIAGEMVLRRIDTGRPKGRVGTEVLYELVGARETMPEAAVRAVEQYEAALSLHDAGRWREAAELLRGSVRGPDDCVAARLLRRCDSLARSARTTRTQPPEGC